MWRVCIWSARWCAPYAYKERSRLGCGGADKWTVEPAADAFPLTHWDAGSGTICCDPGYYCANTTSKVQTILPRSYGQLKCQAAVTMALCAQQVGKSFCGHCGCITHHLFT